MAGLDHDLVAQAVPAGQALALKSAGNQLRASVLQNVDADGLVHQALPDAQVLQLDTQANVFQGISAGRADVAVVDASTVKWLVKKNPGI